MTMLAAALEYTTHGWRVFPLDDNKRPRTSHGFKDAVRDEEQLRAWWERWPDANIGIATGEGLLVFDVDAGKGGPESLEELEAKHGKLPDTPMVKTARGGWHYYFRCYTPCRSVQNAGGWEGIDVRCDGGYVMAPPSKFPPFGQHAWEASSHFSDTPLADCPAWIVQMVSKRHEELTPAKANGDFKPDADLDNIVFDCSWLRHCRDDAATLSELDWHHMLAVLAWCKDGQRAAVEWSQPYPGFDRDATARKLTNASKYSPPSCQYVREFCRWGACESCPSWGKVKSPIVLGRPRKPKAEDDDTPPIPGCTDFDAKERFVATYSGRARYCSETEQWLIWTGIIWAPDVHNSVIDLAGRLAKDFAVRMEAEHGPKKASPARSLLSAGHIKGCITLAAADPGIAVLSSTLNRHRHLLACPNGIVNLRTGELLKPEPSLFLTQLCPTEYHPDAEAPRWEQFIEEITCSRGDLVVWHQHWLGYCCTAEVREEKFEIAHGMGANGKNTMFESVSFVMGRDFAGEAPAKFLVTRDDNPHPAELYSLRGLRVVTCEEVSDNARWDESRVKKLTSTGTVRARPMYGGWVDVDPTWKFCVHLNNRPDVWDTSKGLWRRVALVPFDADFDQPGVKDEGLKETLQSEAVGILAWLVRGAVSWYAHGLPACAIVVAATADYRNEQDPVGRWIEETLAAGIKSLPARNAYSAFVEFMKDLGLQEKNILGSKVFSQQLASHGCFQKKSGSVRSWWLVSKRLEACKTEVPSVPSVPSVPAKCPNPSFGNDTGNDALGQMGRESIKSPHVCAQAHARPPASENFFQGRPSVPSVPAEPGADDDW